MAQARSAHEKISDRVWGEPDPSPADRRHLELVRASTRAGGKQVEELALSELDAKSAGPGMMAPPPRGEYAPKRFGGGYRRKTQADWDWYDALSKDEQRRLSERWFAPRGHGQSPDEISERIPVREWLALTRQADLGRAMATGKGTNPKRFGGLRPSSLVAGEPYDFAELHAENPGRAVRHVHQARDSGRFGAEGSRCQFRTSPYGVAYPLANTCRSAYATSAPEPAYAPMRPEDAEAF